MNISRNWLAKYVTIDCDLATLCDKLTMAGIEVEAVETAGTVPAGVVVGKILTRAPHPDSDHMSVCTVDTGSSAIMHTRRTQCAPTQRIVEAKRMGNSAI